MNCGTLSAVINKGAEYRPIPTPFIAYVLREMFMPLGNGVVDVRLNEKIMP